MIFNEGDRVVHSTKGDRGTVLELDGSTVYLEMDNGVEMDFPADVLVLESEYKTPHEKEQEAIEAASAEKKQVAEEIWPLVRDTLAILTERYVEEVNVALRMVGGEGASWDKLTAYHKMNYLAVLTGTTFEKWEEAHKTNTLPRLQLAVMMAMGQNLKKNLKI